MFEHCKMPQWEREICCDKVDNYVSKNATVSLGITSLPEAVLWISRIEMINAALYTNNN